MTRYLVTGGSGRLGRSIVNGLVQAGHAVTSVDKTRHHDLAVDQHQIDLLDEAATQAIFAQVQPEIVIHLAAVAVPFSLPDAQIYSINTGLLYNVINATVNSGAEALLLASSPTIMGYGRPEGWRPNYLPLDENHPVKPWHGYAASKQAMENLVEMAVRQWGSSTRFGVFRPCFVISPEEWQGAPTQQGHTLHERLADPSLSAVALFNYVDARDVADFVLAWSNRVQVIPNGTTFFVGAPDALATAPMSQLVPQYLPQFGDLANHLVGTEPLFDCSRARDLLGWSAQRSWRTELIPPASNLPGATS